MTPPRLVELRCPDCGETQWTIDCDYRGTDGVPNRYEENAYACRGCHRTSAGFAVVQKSPPEFLLQPHPMYPMSREDFERWARILRENFPDHPIPGGPRRASSKAPPAEK